jgi:hypothetical protein
MEDKDDGKLIPQNTQNNTERTIQIRTDTIIFRNLINKYNNSIYSTFEEDPEDDYLFLIGMHSAS